MLDLSLITAGAAAIAAIVAAAGAGAGDEPELAGPDTFWGDSDNEGDDTL